MNYKDSGVDIDKANVFTALIKDMTSKSRKDTNLLSGIGGFSALYHLKDYQNPVLVSSTDGVGTKLKIATELNKHDTIGIDLVAMCINDIITCGAKPLFFLDYLSTSKLDLQIHQKVIEGIIKGCEEAKCVLIGGETAELSDTYKENEYDLAGFAVGVVEKDKIIDGSNIITGDVVIGLASSGLHSNGYSLVRKILSKHNIDIRKAPLCEELLRPTKIYHNTISRLLAARSTIKSIAHITGGGLVENIKRVVPKDLSIKLNKRSWAQPSIFHYLRSLEDISDREYYRTFNTGIGMTIIVPKEESKNILNLLDYIGERSFIIGEVIDNCLSGRVIIE